MTGLVHVVARRFLEPEFDRKEFAVSEGQTLELIVRAALKGEGEDALSRARVALVTPAGMALVARDKWHLVRPKAGVRIVIRVTSGKNILRTLLQILVTVVAIALGQFWIAPLFGSFAGALATAAFTALGNLLINALIPPTRPEESKEKSQYAISSFRNPFLPDGVVPSVFGRHRYAPPFAASTWTEISGDLQYVRAVFCFGYGPLDISDLRIGDTPFSEFDEIDYELRTGLPGDTPLTIYRQQAFEEQVGASLEYRRPRDDFGEILTGSPAVATPVVRYTGTDASRIGLLFAFPAGLNGVDWKGNVHGVSVTVGIEYRKVGDAAWTVLPDLTVSAFRREAFYRQHFITLPTRGRYEVRVTRKSVETESTSITERMAWAALQTFRPEYPFNFDKPLALLAMRIRATYQLNGSLDNVNAIVQSILPDWNSATGTWITRATRWPASHFVAALRGPQNAKPASDDEIDWPSIEDWHDFCVANNLKYDRVHDFAASVEDVLLAICAAGRATPRHDGKRWSVVIDRPQELVIDHINPMNSRDFSWERTYFEPPHAFRVPFLDETNAWQNAERLVPAPGHAGPITLTEKLELPGKTHPDEIFIEASRRWLELNHRPDRFTVTQDGVLRAATRGDLVMASLDQIDETVFAASVKAVRSGVEGGASVVELDGGFEFDPAIAYGCRFLDLSAAPDGSAVSASLVLPAQFAGPSALLVDFGAGPQPSPGAIVHVGPFASESLPLIVNRIERGNDTSAILTLVAAAPEIDAELDALEVPVWIGRVGAEAGAPGTAPSAPIVLSLVSGLMGAGASDAILLLLRAGTGSTALVLSFEIRHRLAGASVWSVISIPVSAGGTTITGYAAGDSVEIVARALADDGSEGPDTALRTITVGQNDAAAPAALIGTGVTQGLGSALLSFGVSANTDEVRIYRKAGSGGVLDPDADLKFSLAVNVGSSYQMVDGDGTRANLLTNGDFGSATGWTPGAGWSIGAGAASKTAGAASTLLQALALTAGKFYRAAFTVAVSSGSVSLALAGTTTSTGAARTATGAYVDRLAAPSAPVSAGVSGDAAFAGSIDNLVLFEETALCLPQGTHTWWVRPFNYGIAGPLAGPFTTIIP